MGYIWLWENSFPLRRSWYNNLVSDCKSYCVCENFLLKTSFRPSFTNKFNWSRAPIIIYAGKYILWCRRCSVVQCLIVNTICTQFDSQENLGNFIKWFRCSGNKTNRQTSFICSIKWKRENRVKTIGISCCMRDIAWSQKHKQYVHI